MKRGKTDAADAEAICEFASTNPAAFFSGSTIDAIQEIVLNRLNLDGLTDMALRLPATPHMQRNAYDGIAETVIGLWCVASCAPDVDNGVKPGVKRMTVSARGVRGLLSGRESCPMRR